jgi:endonuclease YncB( thermonuclease family)
MQHMSPLAPILLLGLQGHHAIGAKTISVIDGSTLVLKTEHHTAPVTLWGVAAPADGSFAKAAKAHLKTLVEGKDLHVELREVPASKHKHYVWITYPFAGGAVVKVNTDMIAKGYAKWDRKIAPHAKDLELWEEKAKLRKRGIWK